MRIDARWRMMAKVARQAGMIAALLGLGAARPARAQVLLGMLFGEKLASENFNIGLEIGMNLATIDDMGADAWSKGTLLGLFGTWRFSEHYHLFVGLNPLSQKGATDAEAIPLNDPQLDPLATGRMTRKLTYLDIPVLLQLAQRRDGGIRVGAGPQVGFLLSANDRYDATTAQGAQVVVENDVDNQVETFDAGVAFDAEYRFSGLGLAIGLRYYYGLSDLAKGSGTSLHNRVLSGSGRITFGGRKPKAPPSTPPDDQ